MSDFVKALDVLNRMTVSAARSVLGDQAPNLTDDEVAHISEFYVAQQRYEHVRRRYGYLLRIKSIWSDEQREEFTKLKEPTAPRCPVLAREFINLLALHGTNLAAAQNTVWRYIETSALRLFLVDSQGVIQRQLQSGDFRSGIPPFAVIYKADVDYFMRHGKPRLVNEAPPRGLPPISTTTGESGCEMWLTELMEGDSTQEHPKAYYKEQALANFKVSGRGFDRVWANALKETENSKWGKAGRKS